MFQIRQAFHLFPSGNAILVLKSGLALLRLSCEQEVP